MVRIMTKVLFSIEQALRYAEQPAFLAAKGLPMPEIIYTLLRDASLLCDAAASACIGMTCQDNSEASFSASCTTSLSRLWMIHT